MSASEYLPLYQSFTNRTHIRNWRRFDQSEISQIVEKNICCSVILSGLILLKSISRTEYILLPYNIRPLTLWTPSGDTIPAGKRVVKCSWWSCSVLSQIICNNITYLRDTAFKTVQFERCWKQFKTLDVSFAAWGVLPCTVWYTPIATSDDGQKCPPCAEVCYDRVSTNLQSFDSKGSKTRPLNLSLTIE